MGIAIDTSAMVELERGGEEIHGRLPERSTGLFVSALVVAELWIGVELARGKRIKEQRRAKMQALLEAAMVVPFTEEIALTYARLYAKLRKKGSPIPANDLAIAATAVHHGHDLLVGSCDEAHFRAVPGLRILVLGGGAEEK